MAQGHRPDRVGDQIRQELSELLSRGEVHDPGIGFITLTRVQVTPDLQLARVYYTTMGDEKGRKETARALQRATPFFRRHVGGRLQLRRVPELEFRFDESVEHQDRIEQIIRDLHEEEAKRSAAGSIPLDDARGALSDSRRAEQDPAYTAKPGPADEDDDDRKR
jgi:ribosome-binding factor A